MPNNKKFSSEGYNISIVGKNVQMTEAIQSYVLEKISKIERFTHNILDITVTMDVQKLAHTASIVMKFLHFKIQVHATTGDLYSAIDGAIGKLLRLIRKYKSKLQNHRIQDLTTIDMKVNILEPIDEIEDINDEIEAETLKEEEQKYAMPKIVDSEKLPLKILTQEEAIMKLELSGDSFLIYKGEEDRKLKVIYRHQDDNLGVIEIE